MTDGISPCDYQTISNKELNTSKGIKIVIIKKKNLKDLKDQDHPYQKSSLFQLSRRIPKKGWWGCFGGKTNKHIWNVTTWLQETSFGVQRYDNNNVRIGVKS